MCVFLYKYMSVPLDMTVSECVCVSVCSFLLSWAPKSVPSPLFHVSSPPVSPSVEDPREALPLQKNQVKPCGLRMWPEGQEGLQSRSLPRGEGAGVGRGGRMPTGVGPEEGGPQV